MILAGDIGGTKTVLALYRDTADGLHPVREATYGSGEYGSLEEILTLFLQETPEAPLQAGCFGVAGPVVNGRCTATNLPWMLEETVLTEATGAPRVTLLNDLEAAAYGMLHLPSDEMSVLNPGASPGRPGNVAVIAAGTGLGEAILYWDGGQFHAIATEGGHASFAPHTDQEIELLRYLRAKFSEHVSFERVLSGPGLYNIYTFLRDRHDASEPAWLSERLRQGDPSPIIARLGLQGNEPLCVATLDLFASIYGAEAGNLALKCMAVGGVFIGGGIAPQLLPVLRQGRFMQGFTNKGRFADFLQGLEVRVVLNTQAPLLGAAHYARGG